MKKININDDIQSLIFDCDGTLVNSMPLHIKTCEKASIFFDTKYG